MPETQNGRIGGGVLKDNLLRQGVDLNFKNTSGSTALLHLDVNNSRIGVNTESPGEYALRIPTTFKSQNLKSTYTNIGPYFTIDQSQIVALGGDGNINLNAANNIFATAIATDNLKIDFNTISTTTTDTNIELRPNGNGVVNINSNWNITGNLHATGDIQTSGNFTLGNDDEDNVTFAADVASNLIPDQTSTSDLGSPSKQWLGIYSSLLNGQVVEVDELIVGAAGSSLGRKQGNAFYVSTLGSDTNVGDHQHGAFRTLKHALAQNDGSSSGPTVIHIFPGVYEEEFPLTVPSHVNIKGEDIRNTIIRPTVATQSNNAFLLEDDVVIEDLTIKDFFSPGHAFSFTAGGLVNTRSPYIRNVTVITQGTPITVTASSTFSVNSQETHPRGITFNNDGTKMFIVGEIGDDVNEYTLSTGFDLSSIVTFVDSFAVTQCPNPTAVKFNADGTKMFVTGTNNDNVHQYALTTGFDVSSASFTQTLVTTVDSDNLGLDFKPDGTKMYITGNQNNKIYEYNLSSAFDISSATFNQDLTLTAIDSEPFGIEWSTDGTRLFIVGTRGNGVDEFAVGTPYDISTLTHIGFYSIGGNPSGIHISPDGTKMFIIGNQSDTVKSYDLSVSYRIKVPTDDPRGFNQGDAGKGALIDGAVLDSASLEASMLFHSVTFITPGVDCITMTNGVRVEWLNSFTYFANRGLYATQGASGKLMADASIRYGAELRSIGSACVYGNFGAVADGANTLMYLIGQNFAYIGAGGDASNDNTLSIPSQQTIELNSGSVVHNSTSETGKFSIGDNFFVDFDTGETSIDANSIDFSGIGNITVNNGVEVTYIDGERVDTGNIRITGNTITTLDGDLNLSPETALFNTDNNTGLIVSRGTTLQQNNETADIRFNTDTSLFEGYSSGNLSFGGVYSSDRQEGVDAHDTNNTIVLTVGSTQIGSIDSNSTNLHGLSDGDILFDNNLITTTLSNSDLELRRTTAANVVDIFDIEMKENNFSNSSNNLLALATTGTGYVKFSGTTGLVVPAGNDAARNSTPVTGEVRYNTQLGAGLGFMEVYNETGGEDELGAWQRAAGEGEEVTEDILKELVDIFTLVLG